MGKGILGSIDGDNPAAMRYTEARMSKISDLMLQDIEKNTVNFVPNYDGNATEPSVLPNVVPQLLLNGTMGLRLGWRPNIPPPHNLNELLDAVQHLMDHPDASIEIYCNILKVQIFQPEQRSMMVVVLAEMYKTGRGGVVMRSKVKHEELKGGRDALVVAEIPYQVNKSDLIVKIADLVRDKKITGIHDLRDESSNREGIRLVIELKKDAFPKKILNQLFKFTTLQKSFNLNMIALVDKVHPRLLNLKEVLEYFLAHRYEVLQRKTQYDLEVAEARAHILEGLKIALDNIDEVIQIIRQSPTKEEAAVALQEKFGLSDRQTKAILEMRLQTLAGLERQKIEDELAEKMALIGELKGILASKDLQSSIISDEMTAIKEKYGDVRRTTVHPHGLGKFNAKDTIPDEEMLVVLTQENYIKRMSPSSSDRNDEEVLRVWFEDQRR